MSADMIDYVLGCAESGATTRFAYENAMMARYQYDRLRSDLVAARAELEAQREIDDGVHRAICELCGLPDEATVYAVKMVIDQRDAAIAEAEKLRAEKKQYRDRAIALRNQARAWRDTVYKTVLLD